MSPVGCENGVNKHKSSLMVQHFPFSVLTRIGFPLCVMYYFNFFGTNLGSQMRYYKNDWRANACACQLMERQGHNLLSQKIN